MNPDSWLDAVVRLKSRTWRSWRTRPYAGSGLEAKLVANDSGDGLLREGPTYGLTPPSKAHREAIGSVVYRLSELMFGSLLASYVLGFIGFSAPKTAAAFADGNIVVLYPEVLTYLFVSMSFAYLTAGLYISYHAGILTMPHLPFSNLRWDYLIALLHSVLFGISMLLPLWLPLCVGFVVLFAIMRQYGEYKELVYTLKDINPTSNQGEHRGKNINPTGKHEEYREARGRAAADRREQRERAAADRKEQKEHLRQFRTRFGRELKKASYLTSWWNVSGKTLLGSSLLISSGLTAIYLEYLEIFQMKHFIPALTGASFLGVMFVVNRVLRDRANFMYSPSEKKKVDAQFWELVDKLAEGSGSDVKT